MYKILEDSMDKSAVGSHLLPELEKESCRDQIEHHMVEMVICEHSGMELVEVGHSMGGWAY